MFYSKHLIVMICYARSGGTLLNKLIASDSRFLALSEINPLGHGRSADGPLDLSQQAKNWYAVDIPKDLDFVQSVHFLEQWCRENNKRLFIRDWTYVNFSPDRKNNFTPSKELSLIRTLKNANIEFFAFAYVRNPIDVWLSRNLHEGTPRELLEFTESVRNEKLEIFRYEDLCRSPENFLRELYGFFQMEPHSNWENFSNEQRVSGDNQNDPFGSRGAKTRKVTKLERKTISYRKIKTLQTNKDLKKICQLLGYNNDYFDAEHYKLNLKERLKAELQEIFILLKKLARRK